MHSDSQEEKLRQQEGELLLQPNVMHQTAKNYQSLFVQFVLQS